MPCPAVDSIALMIQFYENLKQGMSKGEALRQAITSIEYLRNDYNSGGRT